MAILQVILAAVGRLFLSLIFILAALNKILDWQGAELNLSNAISTNGSSTLKGSNGPKEYLKSFNPAFL